MDEVTDELQTDKTLYLLGRKFDGDLQLPEWSDFFIPILPFFFL